MQLKAWRDVAVPHDDVLKGTFKQSEFAADLSKVRDGTASEQYLDPVKFFERTFITEGMRLLLDGVVRRLTGAGGDPVLQLQTAFGGGKTHTLLAVYHLAHGRVTTSDLRGVPSILDEAGVSDLPHAAVAVIDGNRFSPSQPAKRNGIEVRTLWGELAYQIGGAAAYELVADSDVNGTSPGKELLGRLFKKHAPVIVLMDEMVAYLRQFDEGTRLSGGTFDTVLSFVQALTETMTSLPNCMLLASLPESNTEMGSVMGRKALAALEKYFGRVHAIWKPVAAEEAFEIVRRRLFSPIDDTAAVDETCQAFADYYRENPQRFPTETQTAEYVGRMQRSYPIHPEIFTRLYEDWSSLDTFQRTRGVLQLLATVVHRLWADGCREPMIMPGSIPLGDGKVKNQSIYYLPTGWDPVVDRDIDGPCAQPTQIDSQDSRLGAVQAARRAARTIFLASAPSVAGQFVRGAKQEQVVLGAASPEFQASIIVDALARLKDRLHYLNCEDSRYWFDVRPNLRREMEDRKKRFRFPADTIGELRSRLQKMINKGCFGGVHVFVDSADLPDDTDLRLCVLSPEHPWRRKDSKAVVQAEQLLDSRGKSPRQRRNRLLFLAADFDTIPRLDDQASAYLAWKSIVDDIAAMKLNLDQLQAKQAKQNLDGASRSLDRMIAEAYVCLLCPLQNDPTAGKVEWESFRLDPSSKSVAAQIEKKLTDEEILIQEWSPIHLDAMLKRWYWREDVVAKPLQTLWQDMCSYLYLPRLSGERVFKKAVANGVASGDYFAYADGSDGDRYLGFKLGIEPAVTLDGSSLLVALECAKEYAAELGQQKQVEVPTTPDQTSSDTPSKGPSAPVTDQGKLSASPFNDDVPKPKPKVAFDGNVKLDPLKGLISFQEIFNEVIQHLTKSPGVNVELSLEIHAKAKEGFDDHTIRTVRENCTNLEFDNAEFDE